MVGPQPFISIVSSHVEQPAFSESVNLLLSMDIVTNLTRITCFANIEVGRVSQNKHILSALLTQGSGVCCKLYFRYELCLHGGWACVTD